MYLPFCGVRLSYVLTVEQVIVLWTATTERFSEIVDGLNDTAENLLSAIEVMNLI